MNNSKLINVKTFTLINTDCSIGKWLINWKLLSRQFSIGHELTEQIEKNTFKTSDKKLQIPACR